MEKEVERRVRHSSSPLSSLAPSSSSFSNPGNGMRRSRQMWVTLTNLLSEATASVSLMDGPAAHSYKL